LELEASHVQDSSDVDRCNWTCRNRPPHAGERRRLVCGHTRRLATQVVVNQPFTISFSLRQHGQRLIGHQTGSVEFEEEEKAGSDAIAV
jgi:hypothetical protein